MLCGASIAYGLTNGGYARKATHAPIDKFSQTVIVAQLELLFTYAQRAYERQFITRKITNHQVLEQLETLLTGYFNDDRRRLDGLPTVQYLADAVHPSPKYLGTRLKQLTGQTAQQLIHEKLVENAKEKLSTTRLSIAEIVYELGFEHAQSFSKLFKQKTSQTPLASAPPSGSRLYIFVGCLYRISTYIICQEFFLLLMHQTRAGTALHDPGAGGVQWPVAWCAIDGKLYFHDQKYLENQCFRFYMVLCLMRKY